MREVNTEICQLGNVMYFRTTKEAFWKLKCGGSWQVQAGSELITDYGYGYWPDFESCQVTTKSNLMELLNRL